VSYRTILLHLSDGAVENHRIEAAVQLAVAHDAHLIALQVPMPLYLPWTPNHGLRGQIEAQHKADQEARLQAGQDAFEAAAAKAGLVRRELRVARTDPRDALNLHARYADLVIMGQSDPGSADSSSSILEDVIMSCGRAVLVLPYIGLLQPVGRHALVAWDASQEAARAVANALPLLTRADQVTVVSVDPKPSAAGHGQRPGADLGLYLARHGIDVEIANVQSAGIGVGDVLLNQASDRNADLIVMGCYGHTRLRELVLGGATRTVLKTAPVPLLMSH